MSESFVAAVVQDCAVVFDRVATLEKVRNLTAQAAKLGARVIVFPEAFVSGYPKGLDFGARIGMRKSEGRDDFRRYFESAIDVPGPDTEFIGAAAKAAKAHLVIGVIERDGGTLYCTILFFAPDGSLLGKHRKLMPTAMERLVWGFGDGSTMPVFDTEVGRLGAVICWENYMPLMRTAMYAKQIQLYCAPTADDRDSWAPSMIHVALEGRCYVLSACQYLTRGDCPDNYDTVHDDDPKTVMMRGGSCIVSPLGEMLTGPDFSGPTILTAEVDLGEIARNKYDLDVTGHYARPDVFRLYVNERPMRAVINSVGEAADPFGAHEDAGE
jgi:nitrilase